jgi:hypothetical protein
MRAIAVLLCVVGLPAAAAETATWPPSDAVMARMHELQDVIADPASTGAQREAARHELADLLKSPAGAAKGPTPDEKPARAAIQPFGPIAKPAPAMSVVPVPGVATVDVIQPPRISVAPHTASPIVPSGTGTAIDAHRGHVLQEVPNGFVDPRTGQFTPK